MDNREKRQCDKYAVSLFLLYRLIQVLLMDLPLFTPVQNVFSDILITWKSTSCFMIQDPKNIPFKNKSP